MKMQTVFQEMEYYGYRLLNKFHPHSPGYHHLLIAMRDQPTEHHFDPKMVTIHLSESDQPTHPQKLTLTSPLFGSHRLYPGQVVLHDRIDKRDYFFVYGGVLEIHVRPGTTIYELSSAAPILEMDDESSVSAQLAAESEAFLAKVHTQSGLSDKDFSQRLMEVDPLQLYQTTIHSILALYQKNQNLQRSFHTFYELLRSEEAWLNQSLNTSATKMEDLLNFG